MRKTDGLGDGAPGRLSWWSLPAELRDAVDDHFGGRLIQADTPSGGYSQDMACRVTFSNGRRAFLKGCGPRSGQDSLLLHRAEARISASLPAAVPAPRLLAEFEAAGWMVVAFEDIEGAPPAQPWQPGELTDVLSTVTLLAEVLNPAPAGAPTVAERLHDAFQGWRRLRAARDANEDLRWLDPWALRHLDELARLETRWGLAAAGPGLAHADLRADNMLISEGRVMVVDWPWACTAAAWFDLLGMLPSIRLAGGPEPESIWKSHPVAREADGDAATITLVAKTGFFVRQAAQPPPPGAPTLRAFQEAQGHVALRWLRSRM
jgi:aminoglycoside phosphotransferase (APT) family kinase protein